MERKEAKAVLELLAKGISPETGEMVAQESPFNEPRVIRALYMAIGLFGPSEEPGVRAKAAVHTKDLPAQAGNRCHPARA
jgi:hypothetical protein